MKKKYSKPEIKSERLEATAFACTCSGGGNLESFLQVATLNFTGG